MRISKMCLAGLFVVGAVGFCGRSSAAPATGPEATTAKVTALVNDKPLKLQRPEQVALMFMAAISDLEDDCISHAKHACTMDELMKGMKTADHWNVGHLKFDPRTTDPYYSYTLNAGQNGWEAKAIPKKPGMGGFYFVQAGFGVGHQYYNPKGEASISSTELNGYTIDGDVFHKS